MSTIAQPVFNRILVKRYEKPTRSKSGLYLPEAPKSEYPEAIVVQVGPGLLHADGTIVPMSIAAGDHIIHDRHVGIPVQVDGEDFMIMSETDVLCILKEI